MSSEIQAGQAVEQAQRLEADKHTAPLCGEHKVQFAICGCDGPTAGEIIETEGEDA